MKKFFCSVESDGESFTLKLGGDAENFVLAMYILNFLIIINRLYYALLIITNFYYYLYH